MQPITINLYFDGAAANKLKSRLRGGLAELGELVMREAAREQAGSRAHGFGRVRVVMPGSPLAAACEPFRAVEPDSPAVAAARAASHADSDAEFGRNALREAVGKHWDSVMQAEFESRREAFAKFGRGEINGFELVDRLRAIDNDTADILRRAIQQKEQGKQD